MSDGCLPDGTPQSLYFPDGHQHTGKFKGMAQILKEHGFANVDKLKAQVLFNQPDFMDVSSLLKILCLSRGF
ncbi:hypothetical protein PAXRUDRAFT_21478 [Paxillus rubicundulus Ve08.2h10]|uniref:Uncharacterized protein n=1 Tax=Paxillus rubicundulus Ve08.2h10 TaxID=930991 RepID=A0A0D0CZI6_9AGAM|nr:hypothetical protein PAXRUDRAFT_21478 [Paxillus rubicundulus Ve08.2h10]